MLLARLPTTYPAERAYVMSVVLEEFLGLECGLLPEDRDDVVLSLAGDDSGRSLVVSDGLFRTPARDWLTGGSLPREPLAAWDVRSPPLSAPRVGSGLPVLYGAPVDGAAYASAADGSIRLGLDVFGGIFFLLTRYEELVLHERDEHDRFPARSSIARREEFLERPLVNEYVEVLWAAIHALWPSLSRPPRDYRVLLSHDVDLPLGADGGLVRVARAAAADVLQRRSPGLAARRLGAFVRADPESDPYNTFAFIMESSERRGLRSAFNFFGGCTSPPHDADYEVGQPWFRELMRRIHDRGHEIGLHPSYRTFRDAVQLRREHERVRGVAEDEGIEQTTWGGRQHFLRWEAPTTWQGWEDAGLDYDSTLGFADRVGFRCGTCYEFPVFNLRTRRALRLRERPLVVMENTLLESRYMQVDDATALQQVAALADTCRRFDGDFVLLWHNSSLVSAERKRLYTGVLDAVTGSGRS